MVSISSVYPYLDVDKLFQLPFFTLQVMNRKLAATNIAENQTTDGKQSLQKPEAIGEQNAVVENGVEAVAVNGLAPEDIKPTTEEAAVANGC
jgi:hypothetical protein